MPPATLAFPGQPHGQLSVVAYYQVWAERRPTSSSAWRRSRHAAGGPSAWQPTPRRWVAIFDPPMDAAASHEHGVRWAKPHADASALHRCTTALGRHGRSSRKKSPFLLIRADRPLWGAEHPTDGSAEARLRTPLQNQSSTTFVGVLACARARLGTYRAVGLSRSEAATPIAARARCQPGLVLHGRQRAPQQTP